MGPHNERLQRQACRRPLSEARALGIGPGDRKQEPRRGVRAARRELEAAVRWCVALQEELLRLDWPEALLDWAECAPERDASGGALLWRGLRVRMGMAFGRAEHRKPRNTGARAPAPPHRGESALRLAELGHTSTQLAAGARACTCGTV